MTVLLAVCNSAVLFRREAVFVFLAGPPSAVPGTTNFGGTSRQYRDRPNSRLNDGGKNSRRVPWKTHAVDSRVLLSHSAGIVIRQTSANRCMFASTSGLTRVAAVCWDGLGTRERVRFRGRGPWLLGKIGSRLGGSQASTLDTWRGQSSYIGDSSETRASR